MTTEQSRQKLRRISSPFKSPLIGLVKGSKQLADIEDEVARRYRRNALALFTACAAGLVPWTILLAFTLSPDYHTHHWRLVWTGFDILLFASLAGTAYLGWRRRQAVIAGAVISATLLICDAWFDITLDLGTPGIWGSLASAFLVEVPLAGFLLWRAYVLLHLSAQLIYALLGYEKPGHPLRKLPIFALDKNNMAPKNRSAGSS